MPEGCTSLSFVLKVLREKVEPTIRRMKKEELAEAMAEAVYAIYYDRAVLENTEAATDAARAALLEWKLTAGHALHERDGALYKLETALKKLDATLDATKANLDKGAPAAAEKRELEKEARIAKLKTEVDAIFIEAEKSGHKVQTKYILNQLSKSGLDFGYAATSLKSEVEKLAANHRKNSK